MRFKKIILDNYRQYKHLSINFDKRSPQVFIGVMGTGKTNLLNAVNWCLYKNEPYLSKDSQKVPILNLKEIENVRKGENEKQTKGIGEGLGRTDR